MWQERRKLVQMWRDGHAVALATLVAVEGSSYRKPGARLMIGKDGESVGSISGGCLEAEVVRKASWLIREGALVRRYSTAFDDATDIPYGLGCGGTVDVLIEPAGTDAFEVLMRALEASLRGIPADLQTELPANGRSLRRTRLASSGEGATGAAYTERIDAPQRLLVFGGGDDAQSLVTVAGLLGWRIVVVDARQNLARRERFPAAESVLLAHPGSETSIGVQADDFAVVMTHNFEHDRGWLARLLPARLPYLGLLGARHRTAQLVTELAASLGWSLEAVCERLRAPVGLDLGGDGAETIALSIVAEMQACVAGRPVASRRLTSAAIAEQMTMLSPAIPLPQVCPSFAEEAS